MTKQFLITVDYGEAAQPSHPDAFYIEDVTAYATGVFSFYKRGDGVRVKVAQVNPLPHVLSDHER